MLNKNSFFHKYKKRFSIKSFFVKTPCLSLFVLLAFNPELFDFHERGCGSENWSIDIVLMYHYWIID